MRFHLQITRKTVKIFKILLLFGGKFDNLMEILFEVIFRMNFD